MTSKHLGSCLCGEVRFEVVGEFEHFFLCHCTRCQKDTGSAHAANLFSVSAKIEWLSGQSHVRTFNVPSTRHEKSFCSICGSAVPSLQMNGGLLVVPAGSLDSAIDLRPSAHIMVESRASWDRGLEDIPQVDGLPG
ncbi:GFA family protein [Phenylobacterium sp.]|uniref:GFA family protein n=1 Tax=Phenylobacterium sp. TaxID=1871053 RepID=UPI002F93EAF6